MTTPVPAATWQSNPPEQLLKERFHINTGFHPGQRDIVEQLAMGKRLLVIQRTSWGKSLCYQMASLYYPHLTLVFSPLKALMRDQCQRCNDSYGIAAGIVSSELSLEENRATLVQAVEGKLTILFIAPERLDNTDWQSSVLHMRISMIVIDEAHCISTWGHDFRPHYQRIVRLLSALPPTIPVLGLTATANARVEQDVLGQIGAGAQVIRGTMWRPNLYLNVVRVSGDWEKLCYLGEALLHRADTGIVYTATQSSAVMVASFLQKLDLKAEYYHADREENVRRDIEQNFMRDQYQVVCSTNALGMGIDKANVRYVVHYNVPQSPIHYYQEIGRAGRDEKAAWCILLYDPADLSIQEHLIENDIPKEKYYKRVLAELAKSSHGLREFDILLKTGLSENAVRTILAGLENQYLIEWKTERRVYVAINPEAMINMSDFEAVQFQKRQELRDIQKYAQFEQCFMEFLTAYLGNESGYFCNNCGYCRKENFPVVSPSQRIQAVATHFLDEDFLPYIERYHVENDVVHEAGWSLSYHGWSNVSKLVRASKYENAGPFSLSLAKRAVELIKARYPLNTIDGIVSIPPTKSGLLVETFARRVASLLNVEYVPLLRKVRSTKEQKKLTNRAQKTENVKGAFAVPNAQYAKGRVLLLIDDIYDSGCMLREASRTLMKAGVQTIYPLTITRTLHSDNR
jgi:ATP-dependent DNA helicase RecQ